MRNVCSYWLLSVALAHFCSPASSVHAQSCGCEVGDEAEARYNGLLVELHTDAEAVAEVDEHHLPYGIPTLPDGADNEIALHQQGYVINYDADLRVPTWVAYRLTAEDLEAEGERTECFRRDPRLDEDESAAFCEDYEEPVFDRGHMVPNADMKRSERAMINTYMFTNMVPQHDRFNRYVWRYLESFIRDWTRKKDTIYVVTGAVFNHEDDGEREPRGARGGTH